MENVLKEILSLMTFLNYKMQVQNVYCLASNITSEYKRIKPTWLKKESIYNNDLREIVNSKVEYIKNHVGISANISKVLDSYILPLHTTFDEIK